MDVEAKAKSSLTTEDTENTEEEEVVVTAVLCRSGSRNGFRWLSGEPYHTALEIFSKFRPALRVSAPLWESFFPPGGAARLNLGSARRSDPTLVSCFRFPVSSFFPPLRAPASLREIPFSPIRGDLRHSRALSALRISLCTAEGCHGYNKFSPWLCASVRAPSNFLPFAGPKPQKNLTPAIEQIPPTTVGGTPTLLEPTSAPLRVASLLRYAPVAPPGLHICLSLWTCAIARVFASIRGHLHPSGAALRAVCAASRRSNFVLIPHTCFGIRFADYLAERVGLIQAFGLHPSGAALRSVCAASRRSNFVLIPHPFFGIRFADCMAERVGLIPAFGLHPSGAALRAVCAASRRSNFVLIPHTWRRGWDSNPRDLAVLRFSRPAH